jgi:L-arabinonolactonase
MTVATQETTVDISAVLNGPVAADGKHASTTTAVRILDCHCRLGEGIVFDDTCTAIYFVDIDGKMFHKLQFVESDPMMQPAVHTTYQLPQKMGSFGMLQHHDYNQAGTLPLLCAWEDGFQLYDVAAGKELSARSQGPDVNPEKQGSRLNDGRVDRTGSRYICGGFNGDQDQITMQLFQVQQQRDDGKLVHEAIKDGIMVTNAICWTLDGSRMFLADSARKEIHSYAYDGSGEGGHPLLSDEKLLMKHDPSAKDSFPDGACVDSEGYLWNAIYNKGDPSTGRVQRIHPDTGDVVYTVLLPDNTSQVTCCCFGGAQLDVLFITTASNGKESDQPHAGALYAAKLPFTGRKERRLDFTY